MDIEKLIERLMGHKGALCELLYKKDMEDAATAIITLQAENEKLRVEREQIKAERDAALEHLHGICSACKNYSPYHNTGKCEFCVYEPAREKDVEASDNWQWRGPKKED